jgi:hypothetical protein
MRQQASNEELPIFLHELCVKPFNTQNPEKKNKEKLDSGNLFGFKLAHNGVEICLAFISI